MKFLRHNDAILRRRLSKRASIGKSNYSIANRTSLDQSQLHTASEQFAAHAACIAKIAKSNHSSSVTVLEHEVFEHAILHAPLHALTRHTENRLQAATRDKAKTGGELKSPKSKATYREDKQTVADGKNSISTPESQKTPSNLLSKASSKAQPRPKTTAHKRANHSSGPTSGKKAINSFSRLLVGTW